MKASSAYIEPIKIFMYKITNLTNNKIYIGQTENLNRRWSEHKSTAKTNKTNTHFYRAINRYGIENFVIEEISYELYSNLEEANLEEIRLIAFFNSTDKNIGYNIDPGGNRHFVTEEQKEKLRVQRIGDKNPFFGKTHSEETINFYRERMKGNAIRLGCVSSSETLIKLSYAFSGEKNPNKKLNNEQVKEIRKLYAEDKISQPKLAKKFNVALITISRIIRRVSWKEVE